MDVHVEVKSALRAGIRLDEFPDHLYEDLAREITALSSELLARVQAATPEHTGRLRSQERVRVFRDKDRITGYVDIAGKKGSQDFAKAAALEYGAHRATKVAAHRMRLDHYWEHKLGAPVSVLVGAYSRTPDIAEVSFERGALIGMQSEITDRLNAVVDRAADAANR